MTWLGRVTTNVLLIGPSSSYECEALVDTGSTTLGLPQDIAEHLGIHPDRRLHVSTSMGEGQALGVRSMRIEVMGRAMTTDAVITPERTPVLLGWKQLEYLNLVVHPKQGLLFENDLPNPRRRPGGLR